MNADVSHHLGRNISERRVRVPADTTCSYAMCNLESVISDDKSKFIRQIKLPRV